MITEEIDHGLDYYTYKDIRHVMDYTFDKAMMKLLRTYGAKTSRGISVEEEAKRSKEWNRQKKEHEESSNLIVEALLNRKNNLS